jgi:arginyl-tRNA synthetase
MANIVENIRQQINKVVKNSISKAVEKEELPELKIEEITVEAPKEKSHGDFSTNIAMQTA